ncbi:MAG: Lrp/AsnC family transcriptional regulator, partial [Steroidobacteraceae bacterium]
MTTYVVDELDRKIIEKLTADARASNRHLAQALGVTEGTVRGRIKRLEASNLIRFSAVTNVALIGAPKVVLIGIQAQLSEVQALCQKIAAMREIGCVIAMA